MTKETIITMINARIAAVAAAKGNGDVQFGLWRECYGYIAGVHACGFLTEEEWKDYDDKLLAAYCRGTHSPA